MKINNTQVLGLFFLLGFLMRYFSFFPSIINHDESTYIVISDALLRGKIYFVDVIDTKPIGIFLVYGLLQKIFGGSIFMLRLITTIWLVTTAYLLYKTKQKVDASISGAIAGGVIYILINSIFTYYGVSPNTEIFFNLFTIFAILLIVREDENRIWAYLLAGILLGVGFLIKYVVLFDGLAIVIYLIWSNFLRGSHWTKAFRKIIYFSIGIIIPFSVVCGYYYSIGALDRLLFFTFQVSGRYPQKAAFVGYVIFILDYLVRFLPITFFVIYALISDVVGKEIKLLGGIWAILVLIVVLLPGKWFGHYFIHFSLPFSFLAGSFFSIPKNRVPNWFATITQPKVNFPLIGLVLVLNLGLQKIDYSDKMDIPRAIAAFLKPLLNKEDQIYVANNRQILYHLLDKSSPIKYIHPSLFWEEKHIHALEINVPEQTKRIFEARPKFMVLPAKLVDDRITLFLEKNYHLIAIFKDDYVYRRNAERF